MPGDFWQEVKKESAHSSANDMTEILTERYPDQAGNFSNSQYEEAAQELNFENHIRDCFNSGEDVSIKTPEDKKKVRGILLGCIKKGDTYIRYDAILPLFADDREVILGAVKIVGDCLSLLRID